VRRVFGISVLLHLERTNVGGFANFRMSLLQRDREIVDPGHYSFQVMPPPGRSITTGNERQESGYVILPALRAISSRSRQLRRVFLPGRCNRKFVHIGGIFSNFGVLGST